MKKERFLLPLMLLCAVMLNAQNFQWVKQFAGTNTFDVTVKKVIAMANGDVYMAGSFADTVDFDPGTGIANKIAQGTDGFAARFDAGGNLVWVYTTNLAGNEEVSSIAPLNTTNQLMLIRVGTNSFKLSGLAIANGTVPFSSATFTSTATVTPEALSTSGGTAIAVVGSFTGALTVGSSTLSSAGLSDGFYTTLTYTNNAFSGIAGKKFGGTGNDYLHDVHTSSNGVTAAGSISGSVTFPITGGSSTTKTSAGGKDALLLFMTEPGDIASADNIFVTGSTGEDEILTLCRNSSTSDVVVGGYFSGTVDFDSKTSSYTLASTGGTDGFVARYNYTNPGQGSIFTYTYANKVGGTNNDLVTAVSFIAAGSNTYYVAQQGLTTGAAIRLEAVSQAGVLVGTYGGLLVPSNSTINYPASVAVVVGAVYCGGYFSGPTDFDPGNGVTSLTPIASGRNGFLHKMSGCAVAETPAIAFTEDTICPGATDTLSVSAALNGNNNWAWYTGTCGGTLVGTGSKLVVSPTVATTYYVRGEGGCAATASCSAGQIIRLYPAPPAPVVTVSGPLTVCAGESVFYSVSATNLSAPFTYQWRKNGVNVSGATNSVYYPSPIANNDVFSCVVTGANNCGAIVSVTSNNVTVTVTSAVAPVVTITTPSATACNNTNVTFTATATNGGTTPTYQWLRNNVPISGATSAVYVANSLILGATVSITCQLTSSLACAVPTKDTSNALFVSVTPSVLPAVSISASATTICANGTVTFTATPTNGGTTPAYVWRKNGNPISGATASTYTASGITNGDVFSCVMTSNATCPSPATATSNNITISITAPVTPAVSISASVTSICAGTNVNFTATPTNGGSAPAYQWKKNGVNITGATTATYSSSTLANNDVITCELTSNAPCVTSPTASSNQLTISVIATVAPAIGITASVNPVCAGADVTFTAVATNGGNSPSYQWRKNGVNITGATLATYTTSSVANNDVFSCVLTSSLGCAVPTTATSNSITLGVTPTVTPAVTISAPSTTICAGSNITFTAAPVNGGSSPVYTWKRNGNIQSGSTSTFSSNSLVNGDVITCQLTSNAVCATPASVNSNSLTVTVNALVNAGISIAATQTTICAGNSVTFTATPVNGGNAPVYQWRKNGAGISGATTATYTTSTLANGDIFACDITSNAACLGNSGASSNAITITVSNSVTPALTISTPSTTICAGTAVTFTASPTNGGSNPAFQWKRNNTNINGATGASFTSSTLANGDIITCVLTSSVSCASPATATSNSLTLTVNNTVTPAITIATPNTTVCAGSSITFIATPVNGGNSPTYTWRENGVDQGNTTATYTIPNIAAGTTVSCVLQSSAACASPATATSNTITITVTPLVTPVVTIATSQTAICNGNSVTFTATPVNGGTTPVYQWKKNDNIISGATSATYTASSIADGDFFSCTLTSNAACLSTASANSNTITITVNGSITPAVNIGSSATSICAGSPVTFTASPTNGGSNPGYQWKKNNVNISGATSATFNSTSLVNGDVITCVLSSSVSCASPISVTSNAITINVNPIVTPTISIATPNTTFCAGTAVTFTATITNGGNAPVYEWRENGVAQGSAGNTHTTSNLSNGDVITCLLVSDATCTSGTTATSNSLTVTVNPLVTPTINIAATQTTVCSGNSVTFTATATNQGSAPTYQWKKNGSNVSGATNSTYTVSNIADGDVFTCSLTSNATCLSTNSATSNALTINVSNSVTPALTISTTNTTFCAGASTTFTASPVNGGATPTYQWKRNNVNISGATGTTFSSSSLTSGDVISCVLTSSVSCAAPTTATSNSITVTVSPAFTPAVTITATDDTICELSSVTFTAAGNGTVANYQWTLNGVNANPGNSITFTPANIADGDEVRCVITSAEACANPSQATSAPLIVTVLPAETVQVTIETGQDTTCAGSAVSFTATPLNGGDNPVYEWSVNGNEVSGTTGSNFTSQTLSNGDVVACILTSSSNCVANSQATSNSITITTVNSLTASVSVTPNQPSVCQGSLVNFIATGVNGGIGANYTWSVNGVDILTGSGGPQIDLNNLNNTDTVRCRLTSSESCVTQAAVVSEPVVVTVNALPNVTITTTGNVLSVPVATQYQWIDCNGNAAINGANSATYTATANGDYKVAVTNANGCTDTSVCVNVTSIGIEEASQGIIIIWPNPFTEGITVNAPEFARGFTINVYNTLGAIVKHANSLNATYQLPLSDLTNGLYFIKVSNGHKTFVKRIEKL